jgi:hypothetical protein
MLERNRRIKVKPERFQNSVKQFDVIVCMEERVYDQVGVIKRNTAFNNPTAVGRRRLVESSRTGR